MPEDQDTHKFPAIYRTESMITATIDRSSSLLRHSVATIVALVMTIIVIYLDTRGEAVLNNQKLQAIVDGVADSVDRQLASWRLSLSAMGASKDLNEPYDLKSFYDEAKRFADLTGTNISFFKAEKNGMTLYAHTLLQLEHLPKFYPLDNIGAFYSTIQNVVASGNHDVSNFFVGPIAGELLSSIVISRTQQPNSKDLLSLNFTSSYLSHILDRIQLPKDYVIGLVDRDGVIGARSENFEGFVGKRISPETLNVYLSEEKGIVYGDSVRGASHDSYRISFRRLNEARGWTVSLLVPMSSFPTVTIGPLSIAVALISLFLANGVAWALGTAQRQRVLLENAYRLSTRRLLDELPGAILRGRFDDNKHFHVTLGFGKIANDMVIIGRFRFDDGLYDKTCGLHGDGDSQTSRIWDVTEAGKVFRIFMNISNADPADSAEYNIYVFDISGQRAAEIAAVSSVRLAALGQMAATLAHEMSQPLNVMALAADNAESFIHANDTAKAIIKLQKIKDFAFKGRKLIDNLLVYSRGDGEDLVPVTIALRRSIDLALDLTHALVSAAKIVVKIDVPVDLHVTARPVELENIFVNLIMNSIDAFMQGEITQPKFSISAALESDNVVIRYSDNAGGIAPHLLDRIFDPFVTTKPVGHGTGLGLSFVSGNIRAWGGQISVRNAFQGAEFTIRLKKGQY